MRAVTFFHLQKVVYIYSTHKTMLPSSKPIYILSENTKILLTSVRYLLNHRPYKIPNIAISSILRTNIAFGCRRGRYTQVTMYFQYLVNDTFIVGCFSYRYYDGEDSSAFSEMKVTTQALCKPLRIKQ